MDLQRQSSFLTVPALLLFLTNTAYQVIVPNHYRVDSAIDGGKLLLQETPRAQRAPAPVILPGNRLDTNFNAFPRPDPAVRKAVPAWLRNRTNGAPTYVIDGNVATIGQLRRLRQNQVESVSVLDGPKAASLYGKNARNGLVMITLKSNTNRQ